MQYKTTGIIIKRTNLGEADRILTIYTKNRGKIKVLAKGVRKTLSKMAGHLEPFCLSDLVLAEGRNLDTITGVETKKCFFSLRNNLKATRMAQYLAEITDKMTHENEKQPSIFHLFEETLDEINGSQVDILVPFFELNFLAQMGYQPELNCCLQCKQKISEGNNFFDFSGGLICERCGKGRPITTPAIKVLRLFLSHQLSYIKKVKIEPKVLAEVKAVSQRYLEEISQRQFNAQRFLQ